MIIPLTENYAINVHKEGEKFVFIFLCITVGMMFVNTFFFMVFLILTVCCVGFFRDPNRIISKKDGIVLSPCDGKVTKVAIVEAPAELKALNRNEMIKISVFLSVFDVHVNRVPIAGKIIQTIYTPGKFVNAALDKSSAENERNGIVIETNRGHRIGFVQIAGLIARRIVSEVKEGFEYNIGDRYGIIRFGSRMDIYLPTDYVTEVFEGQTMIGGETILAKFA